MERNIRTTEHKAGEVLTQSAKFGALTGTTGLLLGSVLGLYRSKTPRIFALASGINLFASGSTFWASRAAALHIRPFSDNPPPTSPSRKDCLKASTLAGAVAGTFSGALYRGGSGIIPGSIVFTTLGYTGERLHVYLDDRHTAKLEGSLGGEEGEEGFMDKVKSLRWTGLQKLSNEEYAEMLGEKLLRLDTEIALIDEKIEKLREEERKQQVPGAQASTVERTK